jgi:hypothetical protein
MTQPRVPPETPHGSAEQPRPRRRRRVTRAGPGAEASSFAWLDRLRRLLLRETGSEVDRVRVLLRIEPPR